MSNPHVFFLAWVDEDFHPSILLILTYRLVLELGLVSSIKHASQAAPAADSTESRSRPTSLPFSRTSFTKTLPAPLKVTVSQSKPPPNPSRRLRVKPADIFADNHEEGPGAFQVMAVVVMSLLPSSGFGIIVDEKMPSD